MRGYDTREDAEMDGDLNLMIVWSCNRWGDEREEPSHCNEGGQCECGGTWVKTGESYNA